MLFGRAVPGGTDSVPAGEMVRLTDAAERDRRSDDDGVGRAAATALPKTVGRIESYAFSRIFLELAAATAEIVRLRRRAAGGVRRVRPHRRRRRTAVLGGVAAPRGDRRCRRPARVLAGAHAFPPEARGGAADLHQRPRSAL